jgi:hypothetical protein
LERTIRTKEKRALLIDNKTRPYKLDSEDTSTSAETIKIALDILGAINTIFASGTNEERQVLKRVLWLAQGKN